MAESTKINFNAAVRTVYDKALISQRPVAREYVARLRRVHPGKTPARLIKVVNAWYLTAVTGSGAAAGAAAIVPNGWVQVPVAALDLAAFLEASVLYALSIAEIHGMHPEDLERSQLLVTAVLLGDNAASTALKPVLGRSVPYWGKIIVKKIPMSAINSANKILGPRFVTKYGTKAGVLVLAKQIPLGIGMVVGAGGNHGFGWMIVMSARKILGPAPTSWDHLDSPILPAGGETVRSDDEAVPSFAVEEAQGEGA